ncbi:hypothetical protein BRC90_08650 [Halobacteriales archaeon QS_4_69_34]|nr:MAG: hypothetical protein BRC90_08650 [Halobacteriales archaeon QS_4_69_34]
MAAGGSNVRPRAFLDNLRDCRYRELLMAVATGAVVIGTVVLFPGFDHLGAGLQAGVSPALLAFFVLVAVVAGVVKGTIGFGYALITTPVFATVIDPAVAVVVLAIPPWMLNVFQVGDTGTGIAYVRREWTLIALALLGTVVGVSFFVEFSTGPLIPFLIAVVILGYAAFELSKGFVVIEATHHPVALGVVGLLEGFFLAVANLGPPLPAYLHTFERDTERYVGGLSMVFTFVFTAKILALVLEGAMTAYQLWLGSAIAVVTVVGLLVGTYLRRVEIDERRFNLAVVGLLLVIGLNILRKTIPVLFL